MKRFGIIRLAALLLVAVGAGALAQAARLTALGSVERGNWGFHEIGHRGSATREICVRDPRQLLTLMHGAAQCSHYVIEDTPTKLTVQYQCPGAGHGRTTIKIEDRNLIRLQTQGLVKGAPFDLDYEGRFAGRC